MKRPVRLAHVITDLHVGGAEMSLTRLLACLPREEFTTLVISLLPDGSLACRVRDLGITVASLGVRRRFPSPLSSVRLRRILRAFDPDLIQGWMYHGNLAAWLGGHLLPRKIPIAWSVRQSLYNLRRERRGTRLAIRAGAWLAGSVNGVIYNSELSRRQHEALGYPTSRSLVIANGFDLSVYHPSSEARLSLREELGVARDGLVVGMVSRLHPMKGHTTFLESARAVLDAGLEVTFFCAGRGVHPDASPIRRVTERLRLENRVRFLGEREDTARLMAGADVLCMSSSWGEGLPNAVGEAMACGTPCVVTDIGDSAQLVGDTGVVVPAGDSDALAGGLLQLLRLPPESRGSLGERARARIAASYSLERNASAHRVLYRDLVELPHE